MVIRVEQGKGAKDRLALLSPRLLEELRGHFRREQPSDFLFPSRDRRGHLCAAALKHAFAKAKRRADIKSPEEFIFFVMPSQPTCSKPTSISTRYSDCLDIVRSDPRRTTSISWNRRAAPRVPARTYSTSPPSRSSCVHPRSLRLRLGLVRPPSSARSYAVMASVMPARIP